MTADGKPEKRRNPDPSHKQLIEDLRERWAASQKARKDQREIRRLWRLVDRGTDAALSRKRDPARIAQGLEALATLREKWHGPR
jgi:hypothetical protein